MLNEFLSVYLSGLCCFSCQRRWDFCVIFELPRWALGVLKRSSTWLMLSILHSILYVIHTLVWNGPDRQRSTNTSFRCTRWLTFNHSYPAWSRRIIISTNLPERWVMCLPTEAVRLYFCYDSPALEPFPNRDCLWGKRSPLKHSWFFDISRALQRPMAVVTVWTMRILNHIFLFLSMLLFVRPTGHTFWRILLTHSKISTTCMSWTCKQWRERLALPCHRGYDIFATRMLILSHIHIEPKSRDKTSFAMKSRYV